jgi:hypothetical protein
MKNENDEIMQYANGVLFANLAVCAVLINNGIIKRNDILEMIDVLIDWNSDHGRNIETIALDELRLYIENTASEKTIKEVFYSVFAGIQPKDVPHS